MKEIMRSDIAGLPYGLKSGDPVKGPKRKIFWFIEGDQVNRQFDVDPLATQEGLPHRLLSGSRYAPDGDRVGRRKMCEHHLYIGSVHKRGVKKENSNKVTGKFFEIALAVARRLVVWQEQRRVVDKVRAQGMGP